MTRLPDDDIETCHAEPATTLGMNYRAASGAVSKAFWESGSRQAARYPTRFGRMNRPAGAHCPAGFLLILQQASIRLAAVVRHTSPFQRGAVVRRSFGQVRPIGRMLVSLWDQASKYRQWQATERFTVQKQSTPGYRQSMRKPHSLLQLPSTVCCPLPW